jgi:signal transduction histidine kinase
MLKSHLWVIEDNPAIRDLVALELGQYDYTFEFFEDGAKPLEEVRSGHLPDLILLDLVLPEPSGLDILQQLRQDWSQAQLPIIIVSALNHHASIVKGLSLGANDYLTKPYHHTELHSRIQTQLHMKQTMKESQSKLAYLEKLDDIKDKALMVASHDLKQPMAVIVTGLQILEDLEEYIDPAGNSREHYRTVLRSMLYSAEQMEAVFEEFLNLEAIKSRRLRFRMELVCLNDIIEVVVDQYRIIGDTRNVEIEVALSHPLPDCAGDPLRLKQVIGNLLSNAIKYSPAGGIVQIRTIDLQSFVRVEVQDHGPGISPENIPKAFEMFTSLSTESEDMKGIGVGLFISRQLIEMQRGILNVSSAPEQGSTFWFQLPVAPPSETA